jgi:hypothetical protein
MSYTLVFDVVDDVVRVLDVFHLDAVEAKNEK